MIKNMAVLDKSFASVNDIFMVSFTVNPEFDSPSILTDYINKNDLRDHKWYFLTGSREKLSDVAIKSFKIGSIDEPIFHSAYFALVDRKQRIRGYYEGTVKENLRKIINDINKVVRE